MSRRGEIGRIGLIFGVIAALVIAGAAGGAVLLYGRGQLEPVSGTHGKAVTVTVTSGETLDGVTSDLAGHGLIKSSFWFGQYARFKGLAEHLHAGQFKLDSGMGASAIITALEGTPDAAPGRLVLAEGLTVDQMADKVASAGLGISRDQYLGAVAHDTFKAPFLSLRPAGDTSLEGFLFPDTYDVPQGATAHDVVQMQLNDFAAKAAKLLPASGGYDRLIIASIVEREAKFGDDQPKVASVILNRLEQGMNLQVDATVLYGLHKVGSPMSPADQQTDTPYNSYLHPGLPPTPISNPGVATLTAAMNPASTPFLFYVTDGCGHNHYSETEAEHEQAVARYLGAPCSP
jgi:UPF0755 protein